jgi:hypothetical protein
MSPRQHDRVVHREQLVVLLVRQELQTAASELGAHQQRHRPSRQEGLERRHQIQNREVRGIRRPQHPHGYRPRGRTAHRCRTNTDPGQNKLRHIASRVIQPTGSSGLLRASPRQPAQAFAADTARGYGPHRRTATASEGPVAYPPLRTAVGSEQDGRTSLGRPADYRRPANGLSSPLSRLVGNRVSIAHARPLTDVCRFSPGLFPVDVGTPAHMPLRMDSRY